MLLASVQAGQALRDDRLLQLGLLLLLSVIIDLLAQQPRSNLAAFQRRTLRVVTCMEFVANNSMASKPSHEHTRLSGAPSAAAEVPGSRPSSASSSSDQASTSSAGGGAGSLSLQAPNSELHPYYNHMRFNAAPHLMPDPRSQENSHCGQFRPSQTADMLPDNITRAACDIENMRPARSPVQHGLHRRRFALHRTQAPPQIAPLLLRALLARALLRGSSSSSSLRAECRACCLKYWRGIQSLAAGAPPGKRGMLEPSLTCARTFCSTSVASTAVTPKSSSTLSPACCAMLRAD